MAYAGRAIGAKGLDQLSEIFPSLKPQAEKLQQEAMEARAGHRLDAEVVRAVADQDARALEQLSRLAASGVSVWLAKGRTVQLA